MITRWICEKDNKKWIYPIEKCIYCKGPITKQKSTEAKVIGVTKVNIPSPMHPIIPYNIILLEDKYGNRLPKKTMKKYKIGDTYSLEKAKTESAVIVSKVKYNILESLKECFELLNDYKINEGDKFLIKPSIIEPAYSYQTVNTNPAVLDALISYLKEKKVDIVVGEQSMPGNDVIAGAKKSGILSICKKHEVPFIDLSKSEYIKNEDTGFMIAKEVMERRVINVPVLKTNSEMSISGAMENMIRVASQSTQKKIFDNNVDKELPKLIKSLPGFISIGDGTIGMHGQGPTSLGEPAFLNRIFLSKDSVALDSVFAESCMINTPDYVIEGSNLKIGISDIKEIEIVGYELDALKYPLKIADKDSSFHPRIKIINGKADPGTFSSAMKVTSKLFGISGYEMNIAIGNNLTKEMFEGKERVVAFGDCAIKKINEIGVDVIGEIPDELDDLEKLVLIKAILENVDKKSISIGDKLKSKLAKLAVKIKKTF